MDDVRRRPDGHCVWRRLMGLSRRLIYSTTTSSRSRKQQQICSPRVRPLAAGRPASFWTGRIKMRCSGVTKWEAEGGVVTPRRSL